MVIFRRWAQTGSTAKIPKKTTQKSKNRLMYFIISPVISGLFGNPLAVCRVRAQTAFEPKVRGAPAIGDFCVKGAKGAWAKNPQVQQAPRLPDKSRNFPPADPWFARREMVF
jgi:hypothetical protein